MAGRSGQRLATEEVEHEATPVGEHPPKCQARHVVAS